MHEYSLAQALLKRVEEEARARGARAVRRVVVRIGPLAGVERDLFSTAFAVCREGTLCGSAELAIDGEDVAWQCESCGAGIAEGSALICPSCDLPARLAEGDALILERIELEVADHV